MNLQTTLDFLAYLALLWYVVSFVFNLIHSLLERKNGSAAYWYGCESAHYGLPECTCPQEAYYQESLGSDP
ncbi:putative ORF3a protein [Uxmal virus]|uniref:ORF3a protein n=1 Tax=Uxmal virus TaxID=2488578 RepID=A0A3G5BMI8_9VIRU|nr:putative ORF3a protein [Uxmal virus]